MLEYFITASFHVPDIHLFVAVAIQKRRAEDGRLTSVVLCCNSSNYLLPPSEFYRIWQFFFSRTIFLHAFHSAFYVSSASL